MVRILTLSSLLVVMVMSHALAQQAPPCSAPEVSQFDFWLGEWELSWPAEQVGGAAGETGHGTNSIARELGGCVIQENFSTADGSFQGKSWSMYNPQLGAWQQTWVDNSGGYLLFTGSVEDGRMELRTEPRERDGEVVVNRMVFRDITEDGFEWDWQGSRDGGETWTDQWNISYRRAAE